MKEKQIQISETLFTHLLGYFCLSPEDRTEEQDDYIFQQLQDKLDRMLDRELYTRYKTAPTQEQQEEARQQYLDRKGILHSFRW